MDYEYSEVSRLYNGMSTSTVGYVVHKPNQTVILTNEMYEKCQINIKPNGQALRGMLDRDCRYYLIDSEYFLKYGVFRPIKTAPNLYYYRKFDEQILRDLGFLVLPKTENSLSKVLLKYIDSRNINYRIEYTNIRTGESIIDTTNRPLIDILKDGYKGNRLDVMVSDYTTDIVINDSHIPLTRRRYKQNKECINTKKLLQIISQIDNTYYIEVCLVKE
jgi:hypothetical protein